MREIRSYGSVRGVAGDRYPYRDRRKFRGSKLALLCAGINRHDVENERALQERSSDPS